MKHVSPLDTQTHPHRPLYSLGTGLPRSMTFHSNPHQISMGSVVDGIVESRLQHALSSLRNPRIKLNVQEMLHGHTHVFQLDCLGEMSAECEFVSVGINCGRMFISLLPDEYRVGYAQYSLVVFRLPSLVRDERQNVPIVDLGFSRIRRCATVPHATCTPSHGGSS